LASFFLVVALVAALALPVYLAWSIRRHTFIHTNLEADELDEIFLALVAKKDATFRNWTASRSTDSLSGDPVVVAEGRHGQIKASFDDEGDSRVAQIWIARVPREVRVRAAQDRGTAPANASVRFGGQASGSQRGRRPAVVGRDAS